MRELSSPPLGLVLFLTDTPLGQTLARDIFKTMPFLRLELQVLILFLQGLKVLDTIRIILDIFG